MEKKLYIRSSGMISPQPTFGMEQPLNRLSIYDGTMMSAIEPDYKNILDKNAIRRMSRIIRMGVAASLECMTNSGIKEPDAIITGTAFGCLEDTVTFLHKMVENKEEMLTPTAFIQSTHNTIGSQIAMLLKCHGYNNTFVHRGLSFEQAVLDARLLLDEGNIKHVLVGGIDELTDTSHAILKRFGLYHREGNSAALLQHPGKGTMAGEGAGFFLLTAEESPHNVAAFDHISMIFDPENEIDIQSWIVETLHGLQVSLEDIDLFLLGNNGDLKSDQVYNTFEKSINSSEKIGYFKHLCGEYPTASAFGLWLAATTLKNGRIPFSTGSGPALGAKAKILIYNSGHYGHHSLMLLSAC